jgi:hypothetical protein
MKPRLPHVRPVTRAARYRWAEMHRAPRREVPAWSEFVGIGAIVLVLFLIFVVGPVMAS